MAGLLAKAKALREEGLNAYIWSGGYTVPPTSVMRSVRDDIMFIDEVIGAGEIAVADERAMEPTPRDLARSATDAHVGGMLSRKAGLTHIHVGPHDRRLGPAREAIDDGLVEASWLYPTHMNRTEELLGDAVELAGRGC